MVLGDKCAYDQEVRVGARAWLRRGVGLALVCALALEHARAEACAACGCGDPTLTMFGVEKPFAGRVRTGLEFRTRRDVLGRSSVDEVRLQEQRLEFQAGWSPVSRVQLGLAVPTVARQTTYRNEPQAASPALGDVELRSRVVLFADGTHLVSLHPALKLPTGAFRRDDQGRYLPLELQPGTGSTDVGAGASYGWFARPWSAYVSGGARIPVTTRSDLEPGVQGRATVALQRQILPVLALRAATEGRLDATSREYGRLARDSGGFIGFAGADILVSPVTDVTLTASARVPVVNALRGRHEEGPYLAAAIAFDW
jgi:hypothetical protein